AAGPAAVRARIDQGVEAEVHVAQREGAVPAPMGVGPADLDRVDRHHRAGQRMQQCARGPLGVVDGQPERAGEVVAAAGRDDAETHRAAGDDLGAECDGAVPAHDHQGGQRVPDLLGTGPGHDRGGAGDVDHGDAGQAQQVAHLTTDAVRGPLGCGRVREQAHAEPAHRPSPSTSSRRDGPSIFSTSSSMLLASSSERSPSRFLRAARRSWISAMTIAPKKRLAIEADIAIRVMGSGVGTITAVKAKLRKMIQRHALSMERPLTRPMKFSSTITTGTTKAIPKASMVLISRARYWSYGMICEVAPSVGVKLISTGTSWFTAQ